MKRSTKYVGFDVHQATTLATVRQSTGKIMGRFASRSAVKAWTASAETS